jgi:hypothetical protein
MKSCRRSLTRTSAFPQLPVLNAITNQIAIDPPDLEGYFLIAGQHVLDTTGSLFEWMRDVLNLSMSNTYVVGKSYSTSQVVAQQIQDVLKINYQTSSQQMMLGGFSESYDYDVIKLWEKLLYKLAILERKKQNAKGIFVLDDGGHLFRRMLPAILSLKTADGKPIPIIGIEQTSSGVFSSKSFLYPIIEVATSAAKKLETQMLAKLFAEQWESAIKMPLAALKLPNFPDELSDLRFGIMGLGNVGKAMLAHLQGLGHKNLVVYDSDPAVREEMIKINIFVAKDVPDFLKEAEVILGCTGHNFMSANFSECLEIIQQPRATRIPRIFVSFSSKDTEFNSLLVKIHQDNRNGPIDPLKHILYPKNDPHSVIIAAGMPFNFLSVNAGLCNYSIPHNEIQLTRGLLAAALLQAYSMMQNDRVDIAMQYQLDPRWQRFVVQAWLNSNQKPMLEEFNNLEWIQAHSGGDSYSENQNLYFRD